MAIYMSKPIDLLAYRSELQRKIVAIDVILGRTPGADGSTANRPAGPGFGVGRKMSDAAKARLAAIARARWKAAKSAGRKHL